MTLRDPRALVFQAIALIDDILSFTEGFAADSFAADRRTQLAVERQLISIGEVLHALRRLEPNVVATVPEAPQIIGMRNILVHRYETSDRDLIWRVVTRDLRPLRSRLAILLDGWGT